jgi:hypothetical protein
MALVGREGRRCPEERNSDVESYAIAKRPAVGALDEEIAVVLLALSLAFEELLGFLAGKEP